MGVCPNCGNWVDDGDVCMVCGGGSPGGDESEETGSTNSRRNSYSRRAWKLYMDYKDEEALGYINRALDLDRENARNWNIKGIILESLERFSESLDCYNRSLELSKSNLVYDNRARMLFVWASRLLDESKDLTGSDKLSEAERLIVRAIRSLSPDSDEDIEKYLTLRDSIRYNIDYQNEFRRNIETLRKFDKFELFTITGTKYYDVKASVGDRLRLLRERDNPHDSDAIAVYLGDDKIGYVANSVTSSCYLTSMASYLKIGDTADGEYLLYLDGYSKVQFMIGRLI